MTTLDETRRRSPRFWIGCFRRSRIGSWVAFLVCLFGTSLQSTAANYYMSREGAGSRRGDGWSDAMACTAESLETALNRTLQPGDTLYLAGGDYGQFDPVIIDSSGTAA